MPRISESNCQAVADAERAATEWSRLEKLLPL